MEQFFILLLIYVIPPACLLLIGPLLGLCFATIYPGIKIFRINKEEIITKKGTPAGLVFSVWGIDIGAWLLSFLVAAFTIGNISAFRAIEEYMSRVLLFIVCWDVLYAALLLFSYFHFRKKIKDRKKSIKLFLFFLAASIVFGALYNIAAFSIVG